MGTSFRSLVDQPAVHSPASNWQCTAAAFFIILLADWTSVRTLGPLPLHTSSCISYPERAWHFITGPINPLARRALLDHTDEKARLCTIISPFIATVYVPARIRNVKTNVFTREKIHYPRTIAFN